MIVARNSNFQFLLCHGIIYIHWNSINHNIILIREFLLCCSIILIYWITMIAYIIYIPAIIIMLRHNKNTLILSHDIIKMN